MFGNSLEDEVSVVRDSKDFLELGYVSEEELGGENKEIVVGEWTEFELRLTNNNDSETEPWENINIRAKFFDIDEENITIHYQNGEEWKNSKVYDLRLLNLGEGGAGADIGPEKGWSIGPNSVKDVTIRVKVEELVENLKVQFQAITRDDRNYETFSSLKSWKSKIIPYPDIDTYIHQKNPLEDYSREDHLELATGENGNAYILLSFNLENLPENINSGELNLFQYWGSNFSKLQNSNVSIQLYSLKENLDMEDTCWKNSEFDLSKIITEKQILGNDKWYNFDIGEYLNTKNDNETANFLLKFSLDNYDNKDCRIRFESKEGKNTPLILIEK